MNGSNFKVAKTGKDIKEECHCYVSIPPRGFFYGAAAEGGKKLAFSLCPSKSDPPNFSPDQIIWTNKLHLDQKMGSKVFGRNQGQYNLSPGRPPAVRVFSQSKWH